MTDLHTPSAAEAATQHEIDRRMLERYRPDGRDALQATLAAILLQVDPEWLEQRFGPHPEPSDLARLLALAIRREALLEGEAKIRVLATIAEERSGWPGSLEAMTAGADLLRDMPRTPPPTGGSPQPPEPPPIALAWTGKVATVHADASVVVECTTSDGRPAELHLDEDHAEALGGQLVDPPEKGWDDDEVEVPGIETAREHPAP
ncbi:hypothetical protein [Streptomyces sp. NPDC047968]|uniref:hypothetical protein n=1 Tax=unclassified Streptomyces TaxID=2593676 RepID=UPI00341F9176